MDYNLVLLVMDKKVRVVIIIQARMKSTRLPGKILKKVLDRTLLDYQIERLKKVKKADDIVIATSTNSYDNKIISLCNSINCNSFRGSENDVLSRYYHAAKKFNADCIVRINSDCPLIDHEVVDRLINHYISNFPYYDYVSNILEESYPIGLHTEVFSMNSLVVAYDNAIAHDEREHVTPYIYRNKDIFRLGSVKIDTNLSNYRWTVDYPEDFELIEEIISGIYPNNKDFDMYDILNFLDDNPRLLDINNGIYKEQTL